MVELYMHPTNTSDLPLLQAHLQGLTARPSSTLSVNLNRAMIPQHRFPSSMKRMESRCVSWHHALLLGHSPSKLTVYHFSFTVYHLTAPSMTKLLYRICA